MKCVGYDYGFEKHLARSFEGIKPSSSGSSKRPKTAPKDDERVDEGEDGEDDEGREDVHDPESHGSPPPKRQRVAKGKAKHVRYDWSDAKYHDDSHDEDYKPAPS
jgi:hypothetical protein